MSSVRPSLAVNSRNKVRFAESLNKPPRPRPATNGIRFDSGENVCSHRDSVKH